MLFLPSALAASSKTRFVSYQETNQPRALARLGERLAIHHRVRDVAGAIVGDALRDRGRQLRALANGDAPDGDRDLAGQRVEHRARAPLDRRPHALHQRHPRLARQRLPLLVVRKRRQPVIDQRDAPTVDHHAIAA